MDTLKPARADDQPVLGRADRADASDETIDFDHSFHADRSARRFQADIATIGPSHLRERRSALDSRGLPAARAARQARVEKPAPNERREKPRGAPGGGRGGRARQGERQDKKLIQERAVGPIYTTL